MNGFNYGEYDVFPAAQQLRNEDGSLGTWMGLASIVRWKGAEVLAMPVSWYPPGFYTEQMAMAHAIIATKEMIDSGRCKI